MSEVMKDLTDERLRDILRISDSEESDVWMDEDKAMAAEILRRRAEQSVPAPPVAAQEAVAGWLETQHAKYLALRDKHGDDKIMAAFEEGYAVACYDAAQHVRALTPAAPGPEWVEVTDDEATWPPEDDTFIALRYPGTSTSTGRPFYSTCRGSYFCAEARRSQKDAIGASWIALPPWPAAAVAAARGTREGET